MTAYVLSEFTLASAVATSGTFTVGYPTGTSRGSFLGGKSHKMIANQSLFTAPDDFTISFGATVATITYLGSTTLAAGSVVRVELDSTGDELGGTEFQNLAVGQVQKITPLLLDLGSPLATDDDVLRAAASISAAGELTLLATSFDVPRNVIITSSGDDSGDTFTVVSNDLYGNEVTEVITGANAGIAAGLKAHYTGITITASGASAGTVKIGRGNVLGLPVFVGDQRSVQAELLDGVILPRYSQRERISFSITEAELDAATSVWVVPGFAGTVLGMTTAVGDTITTGGTLTVEIGGTAVDGLGVVVANSSSAGDIDTDTATAGHASAVFTATQALEIVGDSAFNASGRIMGYVDVIRTATNRGTLVTGLSPLTTPTGTNADVRGTYVPETAPDGTNGYALLVAVTDPTFLGSPQYTV